MNTPFYNNGYSQTLKEHVAKTFGWMFFGLVVTFVTMVLMYKTGIVASVVSPIAISIITILEVITVIVISTNLQRMSVGMSRIMFFVYAFLNGITFSTYFFLFDVKALILAFGMASLYFVVMAIVGYFTSVDLTRLQPILVFGLIFLLIFNFIGIFFHVALFERILCFIGVAIFLGCTAYDVQKMKEVHNYYSNDQEMLKKASIISALQLYLDFINIFVYMLRLFSRSDD